MIKRAVGYVRVSTEDQAEQGISLEAQKAKIEAWAMLNDAELIGLYEDAGISGKSYHNRPGLQKALETTCKEKACLIVYSLSRMSRSTKDTISISERLDNAGADLVSLSEKIDSSTAAGKMVFRMLAVLNEFERDQVSERTKAALSHKKSKNERVGEIPYGFDCINGIDLIRNESEQKIISLALKLRESGMTLSAIACEFEQRGYLTKKNSTKWYPASISRLLMVAA